MSRPTVSILNTDKGDYRVLTCLSASESTRSNGKSLVPMYEVQCRTCGQTKQMSKQNLLRNPTCTHKPPAQRGRTTYTCPTCGARYVYGSYYLQSHAPTCTHPAPGAVQLVAADGVLHLHDPKPVRRPPRRERRRKDDVCLAKAEALQIMDSPALHAAGALTFIPAERTPVPDGDYIWLVKT